MRARVFTRWLGECGSVFLGEVYGSVDIVVVSSLNHGDSTQRATSSPRTEAE